jgi:branched-chain amino acid transport system ATP-binding protein
MMLELENVQVGYGRHVVLREISFSLDAGEVLAILGTNGAGKSTLLRAISGLQPVQAGDVKFEGASILRTPAFKRVHGGLALAPEGQQSFPNMSVWENLLLAARAIRPRASRAEIDSAIDQVVDRFPKLRVRAKQPAGTLSGGERQMLSISRALLAEPKLLLLDEPSHGLAPIIVEEVAETISHIAETVAVLVVEQNLAVPRACATRVLVLENAHIVAEGGPELLDSDEVVGAYLGIS